MKKLSVAMLALGCLLASPTLRAQNINEWAPNEISASYGVSLLGASINTLIDVFGIARILDDETQEEIASIRSGGSKGIINASYLYHTSSVFAVGGNVGFNRLSVQLQDKTGSMTAASANIIFAMVDAKLNWFRRDIFGMYSKAGLGVMCINGNLMEENGGNLWLPTAQLSLIGMELGRQFCGFAEIGAGMQGILQVGLKYHF